MQSDERLPDSEGPARPEQLYRHPNARRTPGAESMGSSHRGSSPPSRRTPPQADRVASGPQSESVWDPIHALSRRSRSNTDGFFSPLIRDEQSTVAKRTMTATPPTTAAAMIKTAGPLDSNGQAAGSRPAEAGGDSDPCEPAVSTGAARAARYSGGDQTDLRASVYRSGLSFPSFTPADLSFQQQHRPAAPPTGLSHETSEDLMRLFSPYGRVGSELNEPSTWRSHSRLPPMVSWSKEVQPDPRILSKRSSELTSDLGGTYSSSAYDRAPESLSSESGSVDQPGAALFGQRSRQNTAFSDSLGSFGRSSPSLVQGRNGRRVVSDKEVQTESSSPTEEAQRYREMLELRQAKNDFQLLWAENQVLKRHLFDMIYGESTARQPQAPMPAPGLASSSMTSVHPVDPIRNLGPNVGLDMVPPQAYSGLANPRNLPSSLSSLAEQAQGLSLAASTGPSLGRPCPMQASGARPETPTSLNQQRIIAALASRGQPFFGAQPDRPAASSPLRGGGGPYIGGRSDELSAPNNDTATTARLPTSTLSWPSLAESQRQPISRSKLGTPPEPRTPHRGSEGPSPSSDTGITTASQSALLRQILDGRGQEASITLQQQLKAGSNETRSSILGLIEGCVLALSQDRHGNFLVQRAIGTDPTLVWKLKGHFVELAMSQFGCHVVQRVLDEEERVKVVVVEELLTSRLEESLTSRNSVHVWQKVLEINWAHPNFRSTIFAVMNSQMKGKWAQTARQETGSIICQNIFESADVDEKRDCLGEVLEEVEQCASNQWGVWVVQHIIEHGAEDERKAALDRLLRSAVKLTLAQYGQKAVMSGLKSGDRDFVERYVEILCDAQPCSSSGSGSRRSALVDVALAPQGLQIVTQLLTSVSPEVREKIITTVRKNSVFLKGSKTGLKVHQLCERARAFSGY